MILELLLGADGCVRMTWTDHLRGQDIGWTLRPDGSFWREFDGLRGSEGQFGTLQADLLDAAKIIAKRDAEHGKTNVG